jgi:arginase family enzyme
MGPVIHLIGLPTDQNSSFARGAALAPPAIRTALWSDRGNLSAQSGLEIGTDVMLKDLGDLPLSDVDCAADDALILRAVTESMEADAIPLLLGGDHAVTHPILDGPLYISVDLHGIDPSEAPGVAHPEPGGLTVREVLSIIAKQRARIVGADIVELNPARDVNEITAIVAAKLVREIAAQMHQNYDHI